MSADFMRSKMNEYTRFVRIAPKIGKQKACTSRAKSLYFAGKRQVLTTGKINSYRPKGKQTANAGRAKGKKMRKVD